MPTSLKKEFGLKSPNMMLLGYEGFYRIVGHSWLNVLMVGNVTVAGLEQSKFIPAASGLLGFEFNSSFQLGVGVNLTPDPQAPSHMIAAAGWTPMRRQHPDADPLLLRARHRRQPPHGRHASA